MTLAAGDYVEGATLLVVKKATGATRTKGLVCKWDPSGDGMIEASAAVDQESQSGWAVTAANALSGDTTFTVVADGIVAVTADGTIEPGDPVMCSSSTAGQVVTYTARSITATPTQTDVEEARDEWATVVGTYLGHEDEVNSNSVPTDAADGDVIYIKLRGIA